MTTLTLATLLVVLFGLFGRGGYGRALALGGATAAGAAIVVSGTAIPTFDAVGLAVPVALFVRLLGDGREPARTRQPFPPGVLLLVLFLAWSSFVTLVAPMLFNGLPIVTPVTPSLVAGVVTSSNVAQVAYLLIGVCIVVFLARSRSAGPEIIGLLLGTCTLLSMWRYLAENVGLPFPTGVFDNSPSFAYIATAPGGAERFRGILTEPSALAGVSLVTIAYMLPRAAQLRGWRRAGALSVAGMALYMGIISTSATFVVAGVASALVMTVAWLVGFLSHRSTLSRMLSLVGCVAMIVGLWLLPTITAFVESTVNGKLVSTSYTERTSANTDSYRVFLDSYGFGVGLGSARASSFLPTLLSATGVIGALLFAGAVASLIRRGAALPACRPVVWALVTLLVGKIAAGPDLSDGSGLLWLCLGVLSHAVLWANRGAGVAPTEVAPPEPAVV
jgi:hypothetical protein